MAQNALTYLFPLPNTGAPNALANNFVENIPTSISSNQADLRLDQVISPKMTLFGRGTYTIRSVLDVPTGSPMLGPFSLPEIDFGYVVAYNWVIRPTLINEVRGGFNGNHLSRVISDVGSAAYVNTIGLENLPQPYPTSRVILN